MKENFNMKRLENDLTRIEISIIMREKLSYLPKKKFQNFSRPFLPSNKMEEPNENAFD